jgi:hypothetical protein
VFGSESVKIAPYKIISAAQDNTKIEVREYNNMVLASTPMTNDNERNSAFRELFGYISGDNVSASKISMTAPVFMDQKNENEGEKISMTAPVFMDDKNTKEPMMSFVLPQKYTFDTAPKPTNPNVTLSEVNNYMVATIQFNGRLSSENITKHRKILEEWISKSDYIAVGPYQSAGYNAPFTLPALRRNEVLIPVKNK